MTKRCFLSPISAIVYVESIIRLEIASSEDSHHRRAIMECLRRFMALSQPWFESPETRPVCAGIVFRSYLAMMDEEVFEAEDRDGRMATREFRNRCASSFEWALK